MRPILISLLSILLPIFMYAEDGSELWLRYKALPSEVAKIYTDQLQFIALNTQQPYPNACKS